ncbi:MAG: hypothetical protein EOP10_29660 [Proteobacteria bacterium]|nr:MAG: hypothetical protein EOP10_29660 [Pseudomonadota bacterium]
MDEDKVVGRILASIDSHYVDAPDVRTGHFGYFECIDDRRVADALLAQAEAWLRAKGMTTAHGPLNLNIMMGYRIQTSGFDTDPFLGEPRSPAYYQELLKSAGYKSVSSWSSWNLSRENMQLIDRTMAPVLKKEHAVEIQSFDLHNLDKEIWDFYPLAIDAYRNNYGYAKVEAEELDLYFRPMTQFFSPGTFVRAVDRSGKAVGFTFGYWDMAEAFIAMNGDASKLSLISQFQPKRFLFHTIAINRELQGTTGVYQLMDALTQITIKADAEAMGCLVKKAERTVFDKAGAPTRTYEVFAKELADPS